MPNEMWLVTWSPSWDLANLMIETAVLKTCVKRWMPTCFLGSTSQETLLKLKWLKGRNLKQKTTCYSLTLCVMMQKKNPKTTPRYNIVHWCQLLAFKYFFITLTPAYLNSGHLLSFFSYNEHTSKALLLIIYQIVLRHTLRDFFSRISWWYLYSAHWVPGVVSTLNISALNLFHLFNSDNTVGGGYYYPFYCCWNWGKIF